MTHFWFYVTSPENWQRIIQQRVIGVPDYNRRRIERVKIGDQIVIYLKGEVSIAGVLEATSEAYIDETPVFIGEDRFPRRIKVIPRYVVQRRSSIGIPRHVAETRSSLGKELILQLDFIKNKTRWVSHIQGKNSFRELLEKDFERILSYLKSS